VGELSRYGMGAWVMIAINSTDKSWTRHRYVLSFGCFYNAVLLVWANSLEDALDECIDWLAEHKPGLLCDKAVQEEYERALAEGKDEETAYEESVVDTTCGGNNGHYINSWEWSILAENPSRADLLSLRAL
jgi:hypothetical protein